MSAQAQPGHHPQRLYQMRMNSEGLLLEITFAAGNQSPATETGEGQANHAASGYISTRALRQINGSFGLNDFASSNGVVRRSSDSTSVKVHANDRQHATQIVLLDSDHNLERFLPCDAQGSTEAMTAGVGAWTKELQWGNGTGSCCRK